MEKPSGVYYGQWRKLRAGKCELAPAAPVCRRGGLVLFRGWASSCSHLPSPWSGQRRYTPRKGCPGEGRAQASRHLCRAQFENIYLTHFTDETEVQKGIVSSLGSHSKMRNKIRVRTLPHICNIPMDAASPQILGTGQNLEQRGRTEAGRVFSPSDSNK